jgi:hypothetical protein
MATQKGLHPKQLKKTSSPGPVYRTRAGKPSAVAPVSTANATDLASAEALANALKVTVNALIAALNK